MKIYLKKVPEETKGYCYGCYFRHDNYGCLIENERFSEICKDEKIIYKQVQPPKIKSIKDLPKPRGSDGR